MTDDSTFTPALGPGVIFTVMQSRERSLSQGCLSDLRLERSHHDDCWQISSPIQLLENRRELNMAHLCFLNTRGGTHSGWRDICEIPENRKL